jgi:hypothetical protein
VTIGNSVATIGESAFSSNTSLTSITIPDSVTTIGEFAFNLSPITRITIPANVTMATDSFMGSFANVYANANKAAGTYTTYNSGSTWTKTN